MRKDQIKARFEKNRLVVITRGVYDDEMLELAEVFVKSGIQFVEITYDQRDSETLQIIYRTVKKLKSALKNKIYVGVGTTLTIEQVENAYSAGADFIVSPHLDEKIVKRTQELGLISIPGCMTPSEICRADEIGADYIKFFPAGTLGIKYCKDIFAPLNHLKYIATVGITETNASEFFDVGFNIIGVSSALTDKELRIQKNYEEIERRARKFVQISQR